MKKILITGAGSYVGTSVEHYLKRWPDRYQVDTQDMLGDAWQDRDFSGYDAVFHVAAIVHRRKEKNDPAMEDLYDRVNARLPYAVAQKARDAGVGQFIFMSSESVYGLKGPIGAPLMITADTPLKPTDHYGASKLKAEQLLSALEGDMAIAVLRPPMIYGKGCKGNYGSLRKLALKLPVFPKVPNRRSMLYIENFAEFVRQILDDRASGLFCPQNREYVNTSEMVRLIAEANGRRIPLIGCLTWAIRLTGHATDLAEKAFGSLCYDRALSDYKTDYCVKTLKESILETEG